MALADGFTLRFDLFHIPAGVELLYRGDEVIPLEPRAARVLRYLVEHNDRVLSKEELLEEVWSDVFTTDGVLKKAVSQIRRALGDDADRSRFIATYHGRGYRFIAAVNRSANAAPPAPAPVRQVDLIPQYDQLAGREAELLTLRAELRSALEGNPRPVVIAGEPGIGKTQLARHFRRWTLEQGAVSLYGRFFDYRGARLAPYDLFMDMLRTAVAPEGDAGLREAIEASCGIRLPPQLFVDSASATGGVSAGTVGDHFRFVVPICRCFLALTRRHPVVMVLDDLQWADTASLDLIGCLMRMIESEPLMLVMLVRSDEIENPEHPLRAWLQEHATRRAYSTLTLSRLDAASCREVIGAIFGTRRSGEVPRGDVDTIYRLTEGNPYFLIETLRLLVSANAIVPDVVKGRWVWKGMRDVTLPETIVTAALARFERLPQKVQAVIQQAAVIGDEFRVGTLVRLTELDEAAIEEVLSEGVRSGVLSIRGLSAGEDCRFQHSILRHVVYDSIPPHRRRQLHARAAEALEAVYADDRDRVAEALAAHYSAAGDVARAVEAGMRAWRAASSRSEWRKAVALVERIEEVSREVGGSSFDLLMALGETYRSVGRIRESAAALDRAIALASSDDRALARALYARGLTAIDLSHYPDARSTLTRALELFRRLEDAEAVARVTIQIAVIENAVGNCERAAELIRESLTTALPEDFAAQANGILGWSLALRGRYADGAVLLARAVELQDRIGNIRERAILLRRLHWAHLSRGEYELAIRLAERARSDSTTVGDINGEAKANMGIGQARIAQGLFEEGISFLTRATEQLKVIGDAHCEAECLWLLGRAQCELGRAEEAEALLRRSLGMVREIGDRDDEFRVQIDLARCALTRGNLGDARRSADKGRQVAESLGNTEGSALASLEIARAELASGNATSAAETARGAVTVLDELQSSERWRAWAFLGMAERAAGRADGARVSLTRAVGLLDAVRDQIDPNDVNRRLQIARSRSAPARELSELLLARGQAREADRLARSWEF